jgi:hypothetical protein
MLQVFTRNPVRQLTNQTRRDKDLVADRKRMCGAQWEIHAKILPELLGHHASLKHMKEFAKKLVAGSSNSLLIQPDRIARRSQDGMICWFCQNWPAIVELHTILLAQKNHPEWSDAWFDQEIEFYHF